MKRRNFLITGALVGLSPYIDANEWIEDNHTFKKVKKTIAAVQAHMFPERSRLPSATQMYTINFTEETIFHPTYDRDIRAFVIEGAKTLIKRENGKFLSYTAEQKEKALRAYELTSQGRHWLSRIMILTMEAMFSDPIYGTNRNEAGWKSVKSFGGEPRPKTRYIEL